MKVTLTELLVWDVLHKNLRDMVKRSQPLNPKTYMTIIEQKFEELVTGKPVTTEVAEKSDENQIEKQTDENQVEGKTDENSAD